MDERTNVLAPHDCRTTSEKMRVVTRELPFALLGFLFVLKQQSINCYAMHMVDHMQKNNVDRDSELACI
jgi:hypothetical protein